MAEQLISSWEALESVGGSDPGFFDKQPLMNGASNGRIGTRAMIYYEFDECEQPLVENYDGPIPVHFWNFDDGDLIEQDWEKGNFEREFDGCRYYVAEVCFNLEDVLELIPFEKRSAIAKRFSVASNPDWINTRSARSLLMETEGLSKDYAEGLLLDHCQQGLVSGRAVPSELTWEADAHRLDVNEREWDIPLWFWRNFSTSKESTLDWIRGSFSGETMHQGFTAKVTLTGIHLQRSSLEIIIARKELYKVSGKAARPTSLSQKDLNIWWQSIAHVRDSLSEEQLLSKVRDNFPQHFISRDRLRAIIGQRKRGPKPIRGKVSAN